MTSDFSALNIPELTVNPEAVFSGGLDPYEKLVLLSEFDIENSPFYSGLKPVAAGSGTGDKDESRKKTAAALKALGCHLLEAYENEIFTDDKNKKKRWSHAEQRRVLELAIRLFEKAGARKDELDTSLDEEDKQTVPLEMGKAYLYRSRIIRTKAFTVPAKKKESLKEALVFCEKSKNPEAAHYAGLVALEMDRCGLTSDTSGIA